MKTVKFFQNLILTLATTFVIITSLRVLYHIVTVDGVGLTFGSVALGLFLGTFFVFLYSMIVYLVIEVWKEKTV